MGGNVTALSKSGKETRAEKVQLKEIGRSNFIKKVEATLKALNKGFNRKFGKKIWEDETQIDDAYVFNGSTSFVMNTDYSDDDILPYKSSVGDVDLTIPEEDKEEIWQYLDSIDDTEVIPGVMYMGSNKPTIQSIGSQINTVFAMKFADKVVNVQMDFEFLPFENGRASTWAKFSHSSAYEDALEGIKAVAHKYLLRALVGASSQRDDILVATSKSTYDNIKISSSKANINPRMLKFSVDKGLRIAYEPLLDPNGDIVSKDGKLVYKEIPTSSSNFITDLGRIYKLVFKRPRVNPNDIKQMNSFVSLLKLCKKYLSKEELQRTHDRFIDLLWGITPQRAQELEVQNPDLDREIKEKAYKKFVKELGLTDKSAKFIKQYYSDYGHRGQKSIAESAHIFEISFLDYLKEKGL